MGRIWDRVKSLLGMGAERKWAAELDRVIADLDTMPTPAPPPVNPAVTRLAAEQEEEIRTGIADGLRSGGSFRQIMQEAATYGVKPEEVAAIRNDMEASELERKEILTNLASGLGFGMMLSDIKKAAAPYGIKLDDVQTFLAEMTPEERVKGFHALLASRTGNFVHMEDADGEQRPWEALSPAAKLGAVVSDAAYYGVSFEAFAAAANEHVGPDALLDASLRVALDGQRELTAIDRALPRHDRLEEYPLVDQVKDVVAELAHAEQHIRQREHEGMER